MLCNAIYQCIINIVPSLHTGCWSYCMVESTHIYVYVASSDECNFVREIWIELFWKFH